MNANAIRLMKQRACPVCGGSSGSELVRFRDFQFYSDGSESQSKRVDIVHEWCQQCTCLYMNPVYSREGFQRLFAEAGQSYGSQPGRQDEIVQWISARVNMAQIHSVCDVGCFDGGLLQAFPNAVMRIGVDVDEPAVQRAEEADPDGLYFVADLASFEAPRSPSLFTMFHVLEHVENPIELLASLKLQSNNDSLLILEVPIIELVATEYVGGFFTPQHLTHFSRRTLTAVLQQSGWHIVEWDEQESYNGCRVVVCPSTGTTARDPELLVEAGVEKTGDLEVMYRILAEWNRHSAGQVERLRPLHGSEHVVIWGAGMHTETLQSRFGLLHAFDVAKWSIVDSDSLKIGTTWRGIGVKSPVALQTVDWNDSLLLVSSHGSQDAILEEAVAMGVPIERTICLYDELHRY